MIAPALNRIMYVEDEPDIQTVTRLALEKIGNFTVEICGSGREALDTAPKFEPDLILLDAMMPGMDGIKTLQALRALPVTAGIPVIFFTAKARPDEISRYRNLGALDVIPKPFDPLTLASTIREIWERSHARSKR